MYKKLGVLFALAALSACNAKRDGGDWANDCDRNFSEKSSSHAECLARVAAAGVTVTPGSGIETHSGYAIDRYEGIKEHETGDRNLAD